MTTKFAMESQNKSDLKSKINKDGRWKIIEAYFKDKHLIIN